MAFYHGADGTLASRVKTRNASVSGRFLLFLPRFSTWTSSISCSPDEPKQG